jgi:hypothetical protein
VNLGIYAEPYALRVSSCNLHLEVLPQYLRPKFQAELQAKGIQLNTVDTGEETTTPTQSMDIYQSRQDKLLRIRKATLKYDLSEDNLLRIMKKGAKLQRFTKSKLASKSIYLSVDEAEVVVGNKRRAFLESSLVILVHFAYEKICSFQLL